MDPYYTANTVFVVFAMMTMLAAVNFNTTLDRRRKMVSVGWEAFDTTRESMEEAFDRADKAMYNAKNARRSARAKADGTQR